MKKVLIAEDEASIREFIVINLKRSGYDVVEAENGEEAINKYEEENGNIDVAVLDIMMPLKDGLEVCKYLRAKSSKIGIIMLTAKTQEMDKVTGLDTGADDYITKPFSIEELLARIRSALRKQQSAALPRLSVGPLQMDIARHSVTLEGDSIDLTGREFALLQYLMENQSIVLSRDVLMDKVWGYDYPGETNIVDVYIRYLRNKIDEAYGVKLLHTVRGVGYVLREEKREG